MALVRRAVEVKEKVGWAPDESTRLLQWAAFDVVDACVLTRNWRAVARSATDFIALMTGEFVTRCDTTNRPGPKQEVQQC